MPVSPYGVSKLACEALAGAYASSVGLDAVGMRYFSVYGPRQRPDMAFAAVFDCLARNRPFRLFGNGRQTRDFTFVGDVVEATLAAMQRAPAGRVYNVGGGSEISLLDALTLCERIVGRRLELNHVGAGTGDARRTLADFGLAEAELGWTPSHVLGGRPARPGREHRRGGSRAAARGGTGRLRHHARDPRHPVVSPARRRRRAAARAARTPPARSRGLDRDHHAGGQGLVRARSRSPARWCAAPRSPGESPLASLVYVAAALAHLLRRRSADRPRARARRPVAGDDRPRRAPARAALPGDRARHRAARRPGAARPQAARSHSRLRLLFRSAWFAALSADAKRELLARGVPAERILALPNGVDLDAYRPATQAERATAPRAAGAARGPVRRDLRGAPPSGQGRRHAARGRRSACPSWRSSSSATGRSAGASRQRRRDWASRAG